MVEMQIAGCGMHNFLLTKFQYTKYMFQIQYEETPVISNTMYVDSPIYRPCL